MSKKLFVLFAAVIVMMFAVSSGFAADTLALSGPDDEDTIDDIESSNVPEEGAYVGEAYTATYNLPTINLWQYSSLYEAWAKIPNVTLTFSYVLSADASGFSATANGTTLTVSGTPSTAGDYTLYGVTATVTAVSDSTYSGAVGKSAFIAFSDGALTVNPLTLVYSLSTKDDPISDPDDPTTEANTEGFGGFAYSTQYTLPEIILWQYNSDDDTDTKHQTNFKSADIAYNINWTVSGDLADYLTMDSTGLLSGSLPNVTEAKTYTSDLVATVSGVTASGHTGANGLQRVFSGVVEVSVNPANILTRLETSGDLSDPEASDSNPTDAYAGYNYKATYKLPNIAWVQYNEYDDTDENYKALDGYKIKWDVSVSPEYDGFKASVTSGTDSDVMTVSGIAPDTAGEYSFKLVATLSTDQDVNVAPLSFDVDPLTVSALGRSLITPASDDLKNYVVYAETIDVTDVRTNYSVLVRMPKDSNNLFTAFIESDDSDAATIMDIPEWLTISNVEYAVASDFDEDVEDSAAFSDFDPAPMKSFVLKLRPGADVSSGDKAAVHIPLMGTDGNSGSVLSWNVTYSEEEETEPERPFGIFGSETINLNFSKGAIKIPDVVYTGTKPSYTITYSGFNEAAGVSLDVDVQDLDTETQVGKVYFPVTVNNNATNGSYIATVDLTDGNTTKTIALTATVAIEDGLTLDKETLDLVAGGNSKTVTLVVNGFKNGYTLGTPSYDDSKLTLVNTDGSLTYTISALEGSAQDTEYEITFRVEDNNDSSNFATATLKVKVTAVDSMPAMEISASGTSLDVIAGNSTSLTLTANNGITSIDVSGEGSSVVSSTYVIDSANDKEATVIFTAAETTERATHTFTIKAADEAHSEASVVVTVTVKQPEDDIELALTPKTKTLELRPGGSATATIASTKTATFSSSSTLDNITANMTTAEDNKSVTVEFTADSSASNGDYKYEITATDDLGNTFTATITLTVKSSGSDPAGDTFTVTPSATSLNLTAGDAAGTIMLNSSGTATATPSWSVTESNGLTVSPESGTTFPATLSITAPSGMEAGTYAVKISVTDGDNTSEISIEVTVASTEDTNAVSADIANSVKKLLNSDANVKAAEFSGETRELADVDPGAFAALDPAEVPVMALNEIFGENLSETAIYVLPLSYDLIQAAIDSKLIMAGEEFFVHFIADSEIVSAADKGVFVDNSGNEIKTVPADGSAGINIAGSLTEGTNYWPVISKYKLTLTGPETIEFAAGKANSFNVDANKTVTSWDIVVSDGINHEFAKADKLLTIALSADADTQPGSYDVTVKAYDIDSTYAEFKISVNLTEASGETDDSFTINQPADLTLLAGNSTNVSLTTDSVKPLTWTVKESNGLTVEQTGGTTMSAIFTITAPSTMAAGDYTVIIEATDGTNTEEVSFKVTVTAEGSPADPDSHDYSFALSPTPGSLNLTAGGSAGSVTVALLGTPEEIPTWSVTETSGLTVSPMSGTTFPATLSITAPSSATAGTKTVTIEATNGTNTETATITVTVTASGSGGEQASSGSLSEISASVKTSLQNAISGLLFIDTTNLAAPTKTASDFVSTPSYEARLTIATPKPEDITQDGVYTWGGVTYDELKDVLNVGDPIYLILKIVALPATASVGSVSTAANVGDIVKGELVDADGNPVTELTEGTTIYTKAELSAYTEYEAAIATAASSDIQSSGAGCNGGFGSLLGLLAMAFTGSALYIRKHN